MNGDRTPSPFAYALGRELARARDRSGVSVSTLARWLRMSMREVADIEEGGVPVSAELVAVWCAELGADPVPVLTRAADYAPPGIDVAVVGLRSIAELPHRVGWWAELSAGGASPVDRQQRAASDAACPRHSTSGSAMARSEGRTDRDAS